MKGQSRLKELKRSQAHSSSIRKRSRTKIWLVTNGGRGSPGVCTQGQGNNLQSSKAHVSTATVVYHLRAPHWLQWCGKRVSFESIQSPPSLGHCESPREQHLFDSSGCAVPRKYGRLPQLLWTNSVAPRTREPYCRNPLALDAKASVALSPSR